MAGDGDKRDEAPNEQSDAASLKQTAILDFEPPPLDQTMAISGGVGPSGRSQADMPFKPGAKPPRMEVPAVPHVHQDTAVRTRAELTGTMAIMGEPEQGQATPFERGAETEATNEAAATEALSVWAQAGAGRPGSFQPLIPSSPLEAERTPLPLPDAPGALSAGSLQARTDAAPPAPPAAIAPPQIAPEAATAAAAVQLLWFDPRCLPSLRSAPHWSAALDELAAAEIDPAMAQHARNSELGTVEDYCDVAFVLSDHHALPHASLSERGAAAVLSDHTLLPPLVRVDGTLQLSLDPRERLRATADVATVLCPGNSEVEQAAAAAATLLAGGAADCGPIVSLAIERLHEAFASAREASDADELSTLVDRALISGRHHRRSELFGCAHVCGKLRQEQSTVEHDVYLRADMVDVLPLDKSIGARVLAELRPPQEPGERRPALRVMAVARALQKW